MDLNRIFSLQVHQMWKHEKLLREIWFRWLLLCRSDRVGKRFMMRMKLLSNIVKSGCMFCAGCEISGLKQRHFHASLGFAYETLVFINRCEITNLLPSKFWQVPLIKDPRARPFEHAIYSHVNLLTVWIIFSSKCSCDSRSRSSVIYQLCLWCVLEGWGRGLLICVISSTFICSRT